MSKSSLSREFVMCLSKNKKPRTIKCNGFLQMLDLLCIYKNLYLKIVLTCSKEGRCKFGRFGNTFQNSDYRWSAPSPNDNWNLRNDRFLYPPQAIHCISNFVFYLYIYYNKIFMTSQNVEEWSKLHSDHMTGRPPCHYSFNSL